MARDFRMLFLAIFVWNSLCLFSIANAANGMQQQQSVLNQQQKLFSQVARAYINGCNSMDILDVVNGGGGWGNGGRQRQQQNGMQYFFNVNKFCGNTNDGTFYGQKRGKNADCFQMQKTPQLQWLLTQHGLADDGLPFVGRQTVCHLLHGRVQIGDFKLNRLIGQKFGQFWHGDGHQGYEEENSAADWVETYNGRTNSEYGGGGRQHSRYGGQYSKYGNGILGQGNQRWSTKMGNGGGFRKFGHQGHQEDA